MSMHRVPLLLSLRYWRVHGRRALLLFMGLVAATTLMAAGLLVNDSLTRTYAGWARGVTGWAEIEVVATADQGFSAAWLGAIRAVPGVAVAAPLVEARSYLLSEQEQLSVNVRGVDPNAENEIRPHSIVAGRALEPGDHQVVLLSYTAALHLNAGPGADVALLTPGGLEHLRVVGVYRPLSDGHGVAERAVLMPLSQAQALFQAGRGALSRVDVATDGSSPPVVHAALSELLGQHAQVRPSGSAGEELGGAAQQLRNILLLAGVLGMLAAGVLLSVHVRTMVDERAADMRLIHMLGVARSRLRLWLGTEVSVMVLLAAAPAILLAAPVARLVLSGLPSELLPFAASVAAPRIGPSALAADFLLLLTGTLAAFFAVRYLFAALFVWLADVMLEAERAQAWVRLAGHFARRRVGASATLAAALALTSAGLIGIHGAADANRAALTAWLDESVRWDLRVASASAGSGASVTLPQAAVAQVAALPGVEAVAAERQVAVSSRGRTVTVIALGGFGLDMGSRLKVVQAADLSGSSVWPELGAGRGVALSVPLASRLELAVGDRLPLTSLAGDSEFTVVALVDDVGSREDAAYIALDDYAAVWGDQGVDSIAVRLTPGTDASALASRVSVELPAGAAKVPLHVTLADAYRAEHLAAAADTYRAARLVVLLAALMALLALLAGSVAAAWQAEPELAGLRAMGVPAGRLARALLANLGVVAISATLPGMLIGTALARRLGGASSGPALAWPLDAYASLALLLAITAAVAVPLMTAPRFTAPRAGISLPRQPRR